MIRSGTLPAPGVLIILVTLAGGLAADVRTDLAGQAVLGAAVWGVLFYFLCQVDRNLRRSLIACLVIATAGEIVLSLVWGLYHYRWGNVPLFVPPGHALLLLAGMAFASRMPGALARGVVVCAGIYALAAAAAGVDTLGLLLFAVLAGMFLATPSQQRLYASTFLLSLALECYGTWLGAWTWALEVPGLALVTTNPPVAAGAFYCILDTLVAAAAASSRRHESGRRAPRGGAALLDVLGHLRQTRRAHSADHGLQQVPALGGKYFPTQVR